MSCQSKARPNVGDRSQTAVGGLEAWLRRFGESVGVEDVQLGVHANQTCLDLTEVGMTGSLHVHTLSHEGDELYYEPNIAVYTTPNSRCLNVTDIADSLPESAPHRCFALFRSS